MIHSILTNISEHIAHPPNCACSLVATRAAARRLSLCSSVAVSTIAMCASVALLQTS